MSDDLARLGAGESRSSRGLSDRFDRIRRSAVSAGFAGVATGLVFLLGLASWLPHTLLAPFVPPQHVDRPAAGFAISLPLDWESADIAESDPEALWDGERVGDVRAFHEQVVADGGVLLARTRSPFVHHACVLSDISDLAAEPPTWTSLAHVPSDAQSWTTGTEWAWDVRTKRLELPAGGVVRADVLWADGTTESSYFYMEGTRWFQLSCASEDRPPEDHWLTIAETFEFRPVDVADPAPQRIERPDAGLALTLPYGWQVADASGLEPEEWYDLQSYDDVQAHHAAKLDAGLLLKARAFQPDEPILQYCDLWGYTSEEAQAHVNRANHTTGSLAVETEFLELPAGHAIVIDTTYRDGRHFRDYLVTARDRWVALVCGSTSPPADRWLPIAESLEFLPAE
jgi:hypothetical protein